MLSLTLLFVACLVGSAVSVPCSPWDGTTLASGATFQLLNLDTVSWMTYGVLPIGTQPTGLKFTSSATNFTLNNLRSFSYAGNNGFQGLLLDPTGASYTDTYGGNFITQGQSTWNIAFTTDNLAPPHVHVWTSQNNYDSYGYELGVLSFNDQLLLDYTQGGSLNRFQLMICYNPPHVDLVVPSSITVGSASPAGAIVNYNASASDPITSSDIPVTCSNPSGSLFPYGTTIVSCSAADPVGDVKTLSFSVTVVSLYLGCYQDGPSRDLPYLYEISTTNTPASCVVGCQSAGFGYAGLQFSQECWCGSTYGSKGALDDSSCSEQCSGDQSENCGSAYVNSIYATSLNFFPTVSLE